jgi:hypothetical protein
VGDLFDEFMKELRRRQAEASGRSVEGDKSKGTDDDDAGTTTTRTIERVPARAATMTATTSRPGADGRP